MNPKFKVGDKVKVGDRSGEVVECRQTGPAGGDCVYSVRVPAGPKEDGRKADHEFDTLGCVPEADLEKAGDHKPDPHARKPH